MSDEGNAVFKDDADYVVVYLYRYWDPETRDHATSKHLATLDAIKACLGTPITESGRKVPRTDVDYFGRCRKKVAGNVER